MDVLGAVLKPGFSYGLADPTMNVIQSYFEGRSRIFREEFQEVPVTPEKLLGWHDGFYSSL
jgi:hypothetical protein